MASYALKPEVAAKYRCLIQVSNNKMVWPKRNIHGVPAKKLHELTLEEADLLYQHGAVKGILEPL